MQQCLASQSDKCSSSCQWNSVLTARQNGHRSCILGHTMGTWCLNEDGKVSINWVSIRIWEFYMFTFFFNVCLYLVGFPCGNLHYNELRRILPCCMSVQVLVLRWQWPLLAKCSFVCQFEILWRQFSLISESSFWVSGDGFLMFWGVTLKWENGQNSGRIY